ncbi:hypothetical protein CHISP_1566 [Chitinispirillum alkaliphilum]|nr:hypothetical protein CHISP_1566 [Chitinispirillum alkaliphilum]
MFDRYSLRAKKKTKAKRRVLLSSKRRNGNFSLNCIGIILENFSKGLQMSVRRREAVDQSWSGKKADKKSAENDMAPSERLEMLKNIRKRINKGFYNSDSVLEDLSHAFAKAVDSSL